jgi:hypothetical protein
VHLTIHGLPFRGQNEPMKSERRKTDLKRLIRTMYNYIDDYGDDPPAQHMADINRFRSEFEDILVRNYEPDKPSSKKNNSGPATATAKAQPKGSMDKPPINDPPPPSFGDSQAQAQMQAQAQPIARPPPATIRRVDKFVKAESLGRNRYGARRNDSPV